MKKPLRNLYFRNIDVPDETPDMTVVEETLKLLEPHWQEGKCYCFYPSSWEDIDRILNIDADTFFFCDYRKRRSLIDRILRRGPIRERKARIIEENDNFFIFETDGKRGYYFHLRNREVLEIIHQTAGLLDFFVGVRDGCAEGGNNECTNGASFLEILSRLTPPAGMTLYVDHSRLLDRFPQFNFVNRYITYRGIIPETFNQSPIGPTRHYTMQIRKPTIYEWNHGNLRLTVEHDNILHHQFGVFDFLVTGNDPKYNFYNSSRYRQWDEEFRFLQCKNFKSDSYECCQHAFNSPEFKDWSAEEILIELLGILRSPDVDTIGVRGLGHWDHSNFLKILSKYEFPEPKFLRFFHLDENELDDLKREIIKSDQMRY